MILNKENILNIFEKNNLGKIIQTDFGKGIETDNYNAFVLSCLTETGYVTNKSYGLNFHGLLKIFNSAYKYSLIAGIYIIIKEKLSLNLILIILLKSTLLY